MPIWGCSSPGVRLVRARCGAACSAAYRAGPGEPVASLPDLRLLLPELFIAGFADAARHSLDADHDPLGELLAAHRAPRQTWRLTGDGFTSRRGPASPQVLDVAQLVQRNLV